MRRRWVFVGAVVAAALVAGLAVVGVRAWQEHARSDLQRAMALAPADGVRFSFTDWSGVRAELGTDVDGDSPADELGEFLAEAFDADLSSSSALTGSATTLQARFGFSPASLDWELFGQGETGAALVLSVGDDGDLDEVAARLSELGYAEPTEPDGVWVGGDDLVARTGGLTPELAHVALDADRGLVLASDAEEYLRSMLDDDRFAGVDDEGLQDAVDATGDALAAAVYTGDHACAALAMAQADDAAQEEAERLVEAAGGVSPLAGFVMAERPGGDVRVALTFESDEQARANADSRATLASGPAVGQGGDFAERFALGRVVAEDSVVTMELEPVDGSYVLGDLSTGPVLFATC